METVARIRREHFVKGKTIKEIARDLKVSRNTVRKVLRSGETSFEYERGVQPRPKLGQWTAELEQRPAREQLTLIRIFEELIPIPDLLESNGVLALDSSDTGLGTGFLI